MRYLSLLFLFIVFLPYTAAAGISCDFNSDVGLKYYIDDKEVRPPDALFGNFNSSYVRASLIKGKTQLMIEHIGGAKPKKERFRIPLGEKVETQFKFPNYKKKLDTSVSITDDGLFYNLLMEFDFEGSKHTAKWKCK